MPLQVLRHHVLLDNALGQQSFLVQPLPKSLRRLLPALLLADVRPARATVGALLEKATSTGMDGGHDRGCDGLLLGLDCQEILVLVRLYESAVANVALVVVGGATATAEHAVITRSGDIDLARYGRSPLLHGGSCSYSFFDSAHGAGGVLRGFEEAVEEGG